MPPPPKFPLGAAFQADAVKGKALQSVFRQLDSAERSFFRNLNELRCLQSNRMESEIMPEMAGETALAQPPPARPELLARPAAPAFNFASTHPAPASRSDLDPPAYQFGFVLPKPWTAADAVRMPDSRPGTPPKAR